MIKISIDVTKVSKERLGKGKYLNVILFENKAGTDEWGNDGFVSEDVTKEERTAGTRGKIIGNWKHLGGAKKPASKPTPPPQLERPNLDPDDDIPF